MKKFIPVVVLLASITPLLVSCPAPGSDEKFCLQVLSNKVGDFKVKIEDCKTKAVVPVTSVEFSRGDIKFLTAVEKLWVITADNMDQEQNVGTGRFLSTLSYGKLPEHFQSKQGAGKLVNGDILKVKVSDTSYGAIRHSGELEVNIESD